jgi:type II secretory pathway pseudopilin PulG
MRVPNPKAARGFAYVLVLIWLALAVIALAAVAEVWTTASLRDKEAELLFVGDQFRSAIGRYYERNTGRDERFPKTLEVLLEDPNQAVVTRHLRKIYVDPMTGKAEWGLVKNPAGGIMGVYSLASGKPIKQAGFDASNAQFGTAAAYSDWKFTYDAASATQAAGQPAAPPVPAPAEGALPAPAQPSAAAAAVPLPPPPSPKQPKNCEQIAQADAAACAGQEQRFGEADLCRSSASARAQACAAGTDLPPLQFRYF